MPRAPSYDGAHKVEQTWMGIRRLVKDEERSAKRGMKLTEMAQPEGQVRRPGPRRMGHGGKESGRRQAWRALLKARNDQSPRLCAKRTPARCPRAKRAKAGSAE